MADNRNVYADYESAVEKVALDTGCSVAAIKEAAGNLSKGMGLSLNEPANRDMILSLLAKAVNVRATGVQYGR